LLTTKFSDEETLSFVNLTASYIRSQRDAFFEAAAPLPSVKAEKFKPYFSDGILKSTRFFIKKDGPIANPEFLKELNDRGVDFSFERLQAITFIDVVVSFETPEPRVQFHELVHAVQYQKLGVKQFANKYFRGILATGDYWQIPLEVNAHQLDARYEQSPNQPFSVEPEVQSWINGNRF